MAHGRAPRGFSQSVEVLALHDNEYVRYGLFRREDTLRSKVLPEIEIALTEVFSAG